MLHQIYRKAALKIVQELGEDVFPEPTPAPAIEGSAAADGKKTEGEAPKETTTVEKQDAPLDNPSAPETSTPHTSANKDDAERLVTTVERKPMKVPDTVHVKITPETLKDYVGPQVYQKDRLYVQAPPAGVSTGLGYLGNGSGAVMPIEALVSTFSSSKQPPSHPGVAVHARQGPHSAHRQARRGHPRKRTDRALVGQEPRLRAGHHQDARRAVPDRPRHPRPHARGQHRQGGPQRRHGPPLGVRLPVHEDQDQPRHRYVPLTLFPSSPLMC